MKKFFKRDGVIGFIGARAVLLIALILCVFLIGQVTTAFGGNEKGGVDLRTAGKLETNPPFPEPDDEVEIGIWVENRGTTDADDVSVYFYADGLSFDREVVDVRKGDSVFIRTTWTAQYGVTCLSVVVDPGGEFHDDKIDNDARTWITVR